MFANVLKFGTLSKSVLFSVRLQADGRCFLHFVSGLVTQIAKNFTHIHFKENCCKLTIDCEPLH